MTVQRLKAVRQRPGRRPQLRAQPNHRSHVVAHDAEADAERAFRWRQELLTMREAATEFKHAGRRGGTDGANSFYTWCRKHGIQLRRSGTLVLVRRGDVLRVLDGDGSAYIVERARRVGGR